MPGSFLDTSALAKHYHIEIGSAEVDRQWADSGRDLFVSRIGVVEAVSVFAGKVRTGEIPASAFAVLRKRFLNDVGSGRLKLIRLIDQLVSSDKHLLSIAVTEGIRVFDPEHP